MINSQNHPERLLELDVLRGLAAVAVLFYHYTTNFMYFYHPLESTAFECSWGKYGIELFFIISGYVIFMTLENTRSPLDFIVSRFSRLYPCYWASIVLTVIFINNPIINPMFVPTVSIHEIMINLTMLQYWFKISNVDPSYWTLPSELLFYLSMFLIFVTKKMKYIELICFIWLLFCTLFKCFLFCLPSLMVKPLLFLVGGLILNGNLFFAGILFYNLRTKGNKWYRHFCLGYCFLIQYLFVSDWNEVLFLILFFLIFYLFIYRRLSWIVHKPLIFFGTISYSLYLIHQQIGYIIIKWLYVFNVNPWLKFFIPLLCSILLASLITYYIERPSMAYIRGSYKKWKSK